MKNHFIICLLTLLIFSSCSDENDANNFNVVGTWYGEHTYYNPAGGNKTQYLTIRFLANGTGELDYESPSSISKAYFQYSVSDTEVIYHGFCASSYDGGDYDMNFVLTLKISNGRLVPIERYNQFILSRSGNSSSDDYPTCKNHDYSKKLINIWGETDGKSILNIKSDGVEFYMINSNKRYTYYSICDFDYSIVNQTLDFEADSWFIKECTENTLALNANGYTHTYFPGTKNDIPQKPSLQSYLPVIKRLATNDDKYCLVFEKNNKIDYFEDSGISVNSHILGVQKATLIANGT